MYIESPKKTIDKSPETIFNFLNDVNNYKKLMPDSISKFEILSEKRFLFALKDRSERAGGGEPSGPFLMCVERGAGGARPRFALPVIAHFPPPRRRP